MTEGDATPSGGESEGVAPLAPSEPRITELLTAWRAGEPEAAAALMETVYGELRRLAAVQLARSDAELTWQPTDLLHELYLQLTGNKEVLSFENRAHFFGMASRLLRNLVVDHLRHRQRQKRGGGTVKVSGALENRRGELCAVSPEDLLAVDQALGALEQVHAEAARVVELRFFGGLTIRETAALLEVDRATVGRRWRLARAWLHRHLAAAGSRTDAASNR